MIIKNLTVFIFLIYISQNYCKKGADGDDVFVATKEWRVVKKGQKIPRGLHVRINFETGITEAKLLDENDQTDNNQALSSLETGSDDLLKPDEIKKIKDQYRNYNELKKHLDDLNLTPKIDSEVIADLIKKFKDISRQDKVDVAKILNMIEDLDFLSHQYDNAIEFVKQNGLDEIIYKNLNSTSTVIRRETLRLLGSLMQNNFIPKEYAMQTGCMGILLRILTFDSDSLVKTRTAVALGALLRDYPQAQQKFIESGGLVVISKFFESDDIKIQIKFATLISDLIQENLEDNNLENLLITQHNWCENLNKLLQRLLATDINDHDSIEKCLTAMSVVKSKCGSKYKRNLLMDLERRYENLAIRDIDKSEEFSNSIFFSFLKDICTEILHYINNDYKYKTEL